jgi:very-short-patch-repair endonuclease
LVNLLGNKIFCSYGCGQEAKFQMKNGKICCEDTYYKCPEYKKKLSFKQKTRKRFPRSEDTKRKISEKLKGRSSGKRSLSCRLKISKKLKGIKKPPRTKEHSENQSKAQLGKKRGPLSSETKLKISIGNTGKKRTDEFKKLQREKMLKNGNQIRKHIKKISNEEIKLRNMVKELYPNCEFQYGVFNYDLDVALVEEKIAIEYDGYYHFCSEEKKEYHKQRQQQIENEGWKFYRVTMFDKFPSIEEVKEQIENLMETINNGSRL